MKRKPKRKPADLFEMRDAESRKVETLRPFYDSVVLNLPNGLERDQYPFNIPAIRNLESLALHPKITFFIGENGSGKSTLLEAIAVKLGLNAEGGSRNFNFSTRQSHSSLCDHLQLEPYPPNRRLGDSFFLRAESFFNVATEIERLDEPDNDAPKIIEYFGGKSLHEQSHGESFFKLLDYRFRGDGFYLLDEPEAALSVTRQLATLTILHRHISDGGQFIIATHSPILMAYPDAFIYSFDETGIRRVEYEETKHFRLTRDFLNRRESMLSVLLSDED